MNQKAALIAAAAAIIRNNEARQQGKLNPGYTSFCAFWVTSALNEAGYNVTRADARNMGANLIAAGFNVVASSVSLGGDGHRDDIPKDYTPQLGDVIIGLPTDPKSSAQHMGIYVGTFGSDYGVWASDQVQLHLNPYKDVSLNIIIYRHK
jgi:hypothetical protein